MKNSLKNICLLTLVLAVIVSAVIGILLILKVGNSQEMTQSLVRVLKVLGVLALASALVLGILQLGGGKKA